MKQDTVNSEVVQVAASAGMLVGAIVGLGWLAAPMLLILMIGNESVHKWCSGMIQRVWKK